MSEFFAHYVPLGANCETQAQLTRVSGSRESGFFANGVTRLAPLLSLLAADFSGIFQPENLHYDGVSTLVRDTSHNFAFHWAGSQIDQMRDPHSEEFVRNAGRMQYLVAKFRKVVRSGEPIAFLYVCHDEEPFEPLCRAAALLEQQYGVRDYKIVVLQHIDRFEPPWDHPRVVNRYLERLAPWSNVEAGSNSCWDKIFAEFPLRGQRLTPS